MTATNDMLLPFPSAARSGPASISAASAPIVTVDVSGVQREARLLARRGEGTTGAWPNGCRGMIGREAVLFGGAPCGLRLRLGAPPPAINVSARCHAWPRRVR